MQSNRLSAFICFNFIQRCYYCLKLTKIMLSSFLDLSLRKPCPVEYIFAAAPLKAFGKYAKIPFPHQRFRHKVCWKRVNNQAKRQSTRQLTSMLKSPALSGRAHNFARLSHASSTHPPAVFGKYLFRPTIFATFVRRSSYHPFSPILQQKITGW